MELTNEILEKNGFTTNHPERVLGKYHKHGNNPEWNITLEREYIPTTNVLGYSISCWKCTKNNGAITKRVQSSVLMTVEDVNAALALCEIDEEIKV